MITTVAILPCRAHLAMCAPHEELDLPLFTPEGVRTYLEEASGYGQFPKGNWKARVYAKARNEWADAMLAQQGAPRC